MHSNFKERDHFSRVKRYEVFPHRKASILDKVLVTTDAGEHLFISPTAYQDMLTGSLDPNSDVYSDLLAKQIIVSGAPETARRLLGAKLRTRKSFADKGQTLHLFVVSLRCDQGCSYCQVSRQTTSCTRYDMTEADAEAAVNLMFQSPSRDLTVEFQGGEPLLAFDRIRQIVELVEQRKGKEDRRIVYTMTSTLHHLSDDILIFLARHDFQISTSLDGPAELHDANRPVPGGNAHAKTLAGIKQARDALGTLKISALTTLTRRSLDYPEAIVDEYVRLGFKSIFLRPLSPYGFAERSKAKIGYDMADFVGFYDRALSHILSLQNKGIEIEEAYASILLGHILTPFPSNYVDLRSPAGAGLGTLVYNYDGKVYASDEGRMLAEMADTTFCLGGVRDPYAALMASAGMKAVRERAWAEQLRPCSDCAFLPFCGADPVQAHGAQVPLDMPAQAHCDRHIGLFDVLFRHLASGNPHTARVFLGWALRVPPRSLQGGTA